MLQCYVRNVYEPPFQGENYPRLLYFGETDAAVDPSPRVMHSHDDFVEIILIRSGSCEYLIGSRWQDVRLGEWIYANNIEK